MKQQRQRGIKGPGMKSITWSNFIEMFVVSGIISLLISLIMPVIHSAHASTRQMQWVKQAHQVHAVYTLIMKDNINRQQLINADDDWSGKLMPYPTHKEICICPDDLDPNSSADISIYHVDIRQSVYHLNVKDDYFSPMLSDSQVVNKGHS